MLTRVTRRWRLALPIAVVAIALGAWLAFGYFGFQTAFFDDTVDEAAPVFESADVAADDDTAPGTDSIDDAPAPTVAEGTFSARSHPGEGRAVVLTDGDRRVLRFEDFRTDNGPDLNVYLSSADPDADESALDDDAVDLGDLKGNVGDQNYEIPADVDLERYRTVVVWCVRFGVAFTVADLA